MDVAQNRAEIDAACVEREGEGRACSGGDPEALDFDPFIANRLGVDRINTGSEGIDRELAVEIRQLAEDRNPHAP